jgi:hypothetical protein
LALPHFAKGKAKAAPYEFERRARPVVRGAGACSMGRGHARPWGYCTSRPRSAHLPSVPTHTTISRTCYISSSKRLRPIHPGPSLLPRPVLGILELDTDDSPTLQDALQTATGGRGSAIRAATRVLDGARREPDAPPHRLADRCSGEPGC